MNTLIKTLNPKTLEHLLRWGLVGLIVWLAIMVIGAGAQTLHTSGKAAAAIREYERIRTDAAEPRQEVRDQIRKLSQNNLFIAPPSRVQLPQTQAILGNSVLIGEQWYREGQTVQGFEIVKIGPDFVTVVQDGKEQRIVPFDVEINYGQLSRGQGAPGGGGREGERGMRGRGGGQPTGPGAEEGRMPQQRPGGMGGGFGGGMMEIRDRIESMTPQQRQETFERFRNASPEERERMREDFMRGRE